MQTGKGQVIELILQDGLPCARLSCPTDLIPSPGQYVIAGDVSDSPLPVPLFYTDSAPHGFIAASPLPDAWTPGQEIYLRGPLGRGFALPVSARRIALVPYDETLARLRGLIRSALKQAAAVVLVSDSITDGLSDEVEVQPTAALDEILEWADYAAFDVAREHLNRLRQRLRRLNHLTAGKARILPGHAEVQVLVRTPMPCGGVADCGVCAVTMKPDWKLACKDGPVFGGREILE